MGPSSAPKAKYVVRLVLTAADGSTVAQGTGSFESSGMIISVAMWRGRSLEFALKGVDGAVEPTGFTLSVAMQRLQ